MCGPARCQHSLAGGLGALAYWQLRRQRQVSLWERRCAPWWGGRVGQARAGTGMGVKPGGVQKKVGAKHGGQLRVFRTKNEGVAQHIHMQAATAQGGALVCGK